ncbi:MAG: molybdopterin-dependent oxidoreductase [Myxococcota bacterium]
MGDDERSTSASTNQNPGPPIPGERGIGGLVPFGLDRDKPRHFREGLGIVWENRDNLGYAWRILNHGVCDGCSLGPRGLRDDVLPGLHVCMSRLALLRQNTVGAFDPLALADITRLRAMSNTALRELGRVPFPFVYRPGDPGFRRIGWPEALALAGDALRGTLDGSPGGADRTAWFATSKGITNETYYAFTKVARLLGTNNVDFCARLCHAASVSGLSKTIGYGAPTCSLSDLIASDVIVLWGTNLANNQPVSVKYLKAAKDRGARIVVVNTVREKGLDTYWIPSNLGSALFGTKLADDFVQIKAGGDVALANAVLKLLIRWDAVDHRFIAEHTVGWQSVVDALAAQDLDALLALAGVRYNEAEWLAKVIARSRSMVSVWSMGLTQHKFGTQNVMAVANLHLARGAIGRVGCGLLPIRGHSGVQGGGECGVMPEKYPGGFAVNAENAERFAGLWGHPVPSGPGLSTGEMVEAAHAGGLDFLYNLGGNLFATMPDPDRVTEAFGRIKFRIHQDINVNTSTLLEPAAGGFVLLLPAETRYEQRGGGTSTSTERRIRFSPEIPGHPVIGECRPEYEIPAQVAVAARPALAEAFRWRDSADIRTEMGRVMPIYAGIEDLKQEGDHFQWGGAMLCAGGTFPNLPDGKARFAPLEPPHAEWGEGAYVLTNRRGKQFNSMVFSEVDAIHGGARRDEVVISAADAAREGLRDGDRVRVRNTRGTLDLVVRTDDIKDGHLQVYWPECNPLLPNHWDPVSKEPDYNTRVGLERL